MLRNLLIVASEKADTSRENEVKQDSFAAKEVIRNLVLGIVATSPATSIASLHFSPSENLRVLYSRCGEQDGVLAPWNYASQVHFCSDNFEGFFRRNSVKVAVGILMTLLAALFCCVMIEDGCPQRSP